MKHREWQIAIFGTFDVANYGDLLFPILAEEELSRRLGPVKLWRFSYHGKTPPAWPYEVTSLTELPEIAPRLDAILIGGGFLIRFDKIVAPDYLPPDPRIHHPTGYWLTPALIALQHGIPLIWNAPGMHCNEIPGWAEPLLKLALEQSPHVRVRDGLSKARLSALTARAEVEVLPDTAFALSGIVDVERPSAAFAELRARAVLTKPYLVVHTIAVLGYFREFWKKHADLFRDYQLLLLPIGPVLGDHESILGDLPHAVRLPFWPDPKLLAEVIGHAEGVVGYSYHLAITGIALGVPVFCAADLGAGKYTALSTYEGIFQIAKDRDIDPRWFMSKLGRRQVGALAEDARWQVEAHWDRVADIVRAGRRPSLAAMGQYLQALPAHLEGLALGPKGSAAPGTPPDMAAALAARDNAIAERDQALAHIEFLKNTHSWRITRPLRALLQLLRHGAIRPEPEFRFEPPPPEPPPEPLPESPDYVDAIWQRTSAVPMADACSGATVEATGRFDILCFANINWTARFQRPQQLMRQFAQNGYRIFYIVPSRCPPPGQAYSVAEIGPGVLEVALQKAEDQGYYDCRITAANVQANSEAIGALVKDFGIKTAVSVVHLAYWTGLAWRLRGDRGWPIQYDCTDDWVDFPNIGEDLLKAEEELVAEADLVTVTAGKLYEKWAGQNKNCLLLRNGVDFEFFSRRCQPNNLLPELAGPIIGYYGALAEWVDFKLIAAVADLRPDWNFVLVGDVFVDDLAGLDSKPNVHVPGRRPYLEMPMYLYRFDVCMIPFRVYNVTHAVDPVKFYEFVSAGKPVVSVPLEEMRVYEKYVYFANDAASFIAQIEHALNETDVAQAEGRVALAQANDWKDRFEANRETLIDLFPLVSIIVVTHGNAALTRGCIDSLLRNTTYPNFEIIVVDNASTDDTRNYLHYLNRRHRNIAIKLNNRNLGFAAANNQGLRIAHGDFLVLLNNDTVVPRGWLDPLLRHLRDPHIGLVGPVTNSVGNEARVEVDYTHVDGMGNFAERYTATRQGQAFDIPMLAMFCVAMRRDVFERIGWLDEKFGIGMFEDDDYSRRVQAAGLRTVCAEDAFVHHYGQASFKKLIASGDYQALWDRNQAYFESKWGPWKPHVPPRHGQ